MTTGSERFLKVILIIFNAIFAIGGLISLISGGVALGAIRSGTSGLNVDSSDHSLTGASGLLIAIGVFVFITAVLGCIAAIREHRVALLAYSVILIFILILQLAAAIAAFALKSKVQSFIHQQLTTMKDSIHNDTATTGHLDKVGLAFKIFQQEWKCCGVEGPQDWMGLKWFHDRYSSFGAGKNLTFPGCCYGPADVCKPCTNTPNGTTVDCVAVESAKAATALYTEGCADGLGDFMKRNVGIVAGVALTFGLVQVLGIVLSCCLARSVGSNTHERMN